MKFVSTKIVSKVTQASVVMALLGMAQTALAQGFAAPIVDGATQFRDGIFILVGLLASMVVLWQCYEGMSRQKTWPDILVTCAWVVAAAASIAAVAWLWAMGQAMSFG